VEGYRGVVGGGEDVGAVVMGGGGARWRWERLEVVNLMLPWCSPTGLREFKGERESLPCFLSVSELWDELASFWSFFGC